MMWKARREGVRETPCLYKGFCFYWILHGREGTNNFTQEDKEVTELYLDMKEGRKKMEKPK